jgi:nucleoside-diphosphate-sugar epimerase
VPDIGAARKLLDWRPRYGLDETLRRAMQGYAASGKNQ